LNPGKSPPFLVLERRLDAGRTDYIQHGKKVVEIVRKTLSEGTSDQGAAQEEGSKKLRDVVGSFA